MQKNIHSIGKSTVGALALLLAFAVFALTGCGGGGGGGGSSAPPASVTGRVLRAETGLPPNPAATVTIAGISATTATDGTFSLANVPSNATSASIVAQGSATRTITLALTANQSNSLGDIYLSDEGYTASATGTVVTVVNNQNQPVGNATVTIAGSQVRTDTQGKFTINNLPIGLGTISNLPIGLITAPGFQDKSIFTTFTFVTGVNDLGTQLLAAPVGSTPLPPYTITGIVKVGGQPKASIFIALLDTNGNTIGSTTTDANGAYFFWVVPAQYSVKAVKDSNTSVVVSVTLTSPGTPVTAPEIDFP